MTYLPCSFEATLQISDLRLWTDGIIAIKFRCIMEATSNTQSKIHRRLQTSTNNPSNTLGASSRILNRKLTRIEWLCVPAPER